MLNQIMRRPGRPRPGGRAQLACGSADRSRKIRRARPGQNLLAVGQPKPEPGFARPRAGEAPAPAWFLSILSAKVTRVSIESFSLPYSEAAVEDLRLRLARTRWPDEIPGSGWTYGIDLNFMQRLCDYWKDEFDWKAQLDKLSAFHHYRCTVDGIGIHFIHERGQGPVRFSRCSRSFRC